MGFVPQTWVRIIDVPKEHTQVYRFFFFLLQDSAQIVYINRPKV